MRISRRIGFFPLLIVGAGMAVVGFTALQYLVDNWWPFDTARIDLVRDVALDRIDAATLLSAANFEILLAFLAAIVVTISGLSLPITYLANQRFNHFANRRFGQNNTPQTIVSLRQALSIGVLAAFCVWLQMHRALGIAVVLLVAAVLIMFELLLQIRARTPALQLNDKSS